MGEVFSKSLDDIYDNTETIKVKLENISKKVDNSKSIIDIISKEVIREKLPPMIG